jgi:hypothetical protein
VTGFSPIPQNASRAHAMPEDDDARNELVISALLGERDRFKLPEGSTVARRWEATFRDSPSPMSKVAGGRYERIPVVKLGA